MCHILPEQRGWVNRITQGNKFDALQEISETLTTRAKLKSASQEERIHLWKEHFKNLLRKSPKVTGEPITKIINNQQDIKLGQFMQEELDVVLTKIKCYD